METSASVICKELGFGHAVDWFGLHNDIIGLPGEIYSNVVISTFICPSSESSSEECVIDVDSNIKCRNTEKGATNPVLAVVCKPSPGIIKIDQNRNVVYHMKYINIYCRMIFSCD